MKSTTVQTCISIVLFVQQQVMITFYHWPNNHRHGECSVNNVHLVYGLFVQSGNTCKLRVDNANWSSGHFELLDTHAIPLILVSFYTIPIFHFFKFEEIFLYIHDVHVHACMDQSKCILFNNILILACASVAFHKIFKRNRLPLLHVVFFWWMSVW